MAAPDNVRTQYQDGLVLGAAQLSGDQTYVRAALERRSLTRDMFGIAWGLELMVETGTAASPTSAIVRVMPGVAYGGDGKPIILREKGEVSSLLTSARPDDSWAVYISYAETAQSGQSSFSFCGQAMDPTVAEGTQFAVERFGSALPDGERDGPRVEPQAVLGGTSDATRDRVLLGIVDFNALGQTSVRLARGSVEIPEPTKTPTHADLFKAKAPPAQAEYAGVIASGIAHPRAWTEAGVAGRTITPAIELEASSGIHLRQKTVLHADAHATGILLAEGAIVANGGVAIARPLLAGVTASKVLNQAVAYTVDAAAAVSKGVDLAGNSKVPSDDAARVLGIAMGPHDADDNVRVVYSGLATATISPLAPPNLRPGQWLILDTTNAGSLTIPGDLAKSAGLLVAKFVQSLTPPLATVLVCLG